jgi:hypothetical protein
MRKPNKYPCPDCGGWRVVECDCCGNEQDCEECKGTGLDPDRIDVEAYEADCAAMHKSGGGSSWSLQDKQHMTIGRTNERGDKVLIETYLLKAGVR